MAYIFIIIINFRLSAIQNVNICIVCGTYSFNINRDGIRMFKI